VLSRCIE